MLQSFLYKRFELLYGEYEREQEALEASIAKAQVELDTFEADTTRVDQFLALAKKYTDFFRADHANGSMSL